MLKEVLVYSGPGASPGLVSDTVKMLQRHLDPNQYQVRTTAAGELKYSKGWEDNTALLAMPGGRDLPYLEDLGEIGAARIREYVKNGGRYLGLCAGAYFSSAYCEFELGTPLEVVGERPLKFFPGKCRGATFEGFRYNSEEGARAVKIQVRGGSTSSCYVYYNGGGSFVGAEAVPGVKVVATYDEVTDPDYKVAAVLCKVGTSGCALLTGTHPEYILNTNSPKRLLSKLQDQGDAIELMISYWIGSLLEMKIKPTRRLTSLYLISPDQDSDLQQYLEFELEYNPSTESVIQTLQAHTNRNQKVLKDNHDSFLPQLLTLSHSPCHAATAIDNQMNAIPLIGLRRPTHLLGGAFTPSKYFEYLEQLVLEESIGSINIPVFGCPLLYGDVVTSTQCLLELNPILASALPSGSVLVAGQQTHGKGRGRNPWVSPVGCLHASVYLNHYISPEHSQNQPNIIQYLATLAAVEGILSYCEDLPIRIKWPNDIYVTPKYSSVPLKIGGVLVTTPAINPFNPHSARLVIGFGINLNNSQPTTCINDLIRASNLGKELEPEELLAHILSKLRHIYSEYQSSAKQGLTPFLARYYARWLHSEQIVTLEEQMNIVGKIKGIQPDSGLLEIDSMSYNGTPPTFLIRPEASSLNVLTGQITKKLFKL